MAACLLCSSDGCEGAITPPVGVYEAPTAALTLLFDLDLAAAAAAENRDVDRRPAPVGDAPPPEQENGLNIELDLSH